VFVPLDLADALEVELCDPSASAPGVELRLAGAAPDVPDDDRNLACRAARAFLAAAGLRARVRLHLRKAIPSAAGLGGGSSDAATVLRLLAGLWPNALDARGLARLALGLGADVPYFLDPRPARVTGVGERIEPLAGVPSLALLLAVPPVPLSTAAVYRAYDAAPPAGAEHPAPPPALLERAAQAEAEVDRQALRALLHNDLEAAAAGLCPAIRSLREALGNAGARAVGMSGSGPGVFGIFRDPGEAERARGAAGLGRDVFARAVRTLASP